MSGEYSRLTGLTSARVVGNVEYAITLYSMSL